ncbi:MAG TPA: STAS domain-containing protein [bacterium]|nr:STAS domain-containing protein [bacterium]
MLKVNRKQHDDVAMIELTGEIDGSDSCRVIHEAIRKSLADGRRKFVFNLAGVDWINSLGTGFLVAAAVAASREGAAVRIVGMKPRVSDVLKACGVVPHVWPAYDEESTAMDSFAAAD